MTQKWNLILDIDNFAKKTVMFEASFFDVLQVILVILLIYFGIKIIFRLFGPMFLRYIMKKIGQKVEKKFHQQQGFSTKKEEEGEVVIEKRPKTARKSNKEAGEYIDYEEID